MFISPNGMEIRSRIDRSTRSNKGRRKIHSIPGTRNRPHQELWLPELLYELSLCPVQLDLFL